MSKKFFIFCDASVSIKGHVAIGAFLIVEEEAWDKSFEEFSGLENSICDNVKYIKFETHKSTLAEIKTFLYIMKKLAPLENKKICLFTDCQTLSDLYGVRREKLLDRDFKKKDGSSLAHGEMYRAVISCFLDYDITIIKVKGHKPKKEKDNKIDKLFSIVDLAARKKLREL